MRKSLGFALVWVLAGCGDSAPGAGADDVGNDTGAADTGSPRDTGRTPVRDVGRDDGDRDADLGTDDTDVDAGADADVGNHPPVAVAGPDIAGEPGRPLHFDGTGSHDDDGTIVAWSWTMGNGVTLTGAEVDYTYPDAGVYTVTLTVTDDGGLTDTDSLLVDLVEANEGPVARIEGPIEAILGEESTWDGRTSEDDIGIASWQWTTGVDGEAPHDGQVLDYTYLEWEARPYRLTLRVTDTDGEESVAARDIVVLAPPVAEVSGPNQAFVGDEVTFDATDSYDPDDDAPDALESIQWSFGDGVETEPSPWFPIHTRPTHVYATPGRFDVVASVQDSDGIWRDSTTHKIDVFERPNLAPTPQISAASWTVAECASITLDGRLSLDDTDDAADLTYFWDFGDGTTGAGIETTHAYDRAGLYTVTLTALDLDRAAGETTRVVTVTNVAPTAAFTFAPPTAEAGETVNFDGTGSTDHCEGAGEDRVTGYRWTWGDGTTTDWSASPLASHAWTAGGTYDVTLTVRDDGDPALTHARTQRITVLENRAPVAAITGGSAPADECESVALSGASSTDDRDAAAAMTYTWDFGDGDGASGMNVAHTWERAGTYTVTLTVRDTDGATDVTTRDVTVANLAPVAAFTFAPNPGEAGTPVNFDASTSADRCEGSGPSRLTGYRWEWGDGTMSAWTTSTVATHTWDAGGMYDVTLTVRDDGDPRLTHARTVRITIEQNAPPVAVLDAGVSDPNECESVSFSGSLSSDDRDAAAAMTYSWNFGDGASATGMDVTHAWDREGVYEVRLTVRDTDGATDVATTLVTVANVAPTASFTIVPNPGDVGVAVSFDASGSSDHCEGPGEDRIVGYQWTWGDGTFSTWSASPAASHTYDAEGPYDVMLTVRDDGDPQLTHATSKRLTIQPPDVGPFIQEYTFAPIVTYECAFGLVDIAWSRFELTLDDGLATVRTFASDPGDMTGPQTSATTFVVTDTQPGDGACDEIYRMEGTINGDGTISFGLVADYNGTFCADFGCTDQSWTGRIATPVP